MNITFRIWQSSNKVEFACKCIAGPTILYGNIVYLPVTDDFHDIVRTLSEYCVNRWYKTWALPYGLPIRFKLIFLPIIGTNVLVKVFVIENWQNFPRGDIGHTAHSLDLASRCMLALSEI